MKHPILGKAANVLVYVFVWLVITGAHTKILYMYYNIDFAHALLDGLIYNLLFSLLALGVWYTIRFININKPSVFYAHLNHFGTAIVFLSIWLVSGLYLLQYLGSENSNYIHFLKSALPWRFTIGVLYYFIIILIYYLYIYYTSFKEKTIREANLQALVKETELSLLKSQLHPHFIFNSLNSISSLTISSPSRAQDMLIKLANFLRYALEQNDNKLIPFTEELDNITLYLDIEKVRFGDRLVFEKEISSAAYSIFIPNMILQPLIENAIKYGVYESSEPTLIHLHCKQDEKYFCITISNNYEQNGAEKKGKGIGIQNVKERLHLIYGQKDLVKIVKGENLFEISLYIPV